MRKLHNIKDFESYVYDTLNEDLVHGEQNTCNRAFINGGVITFPDGSSVHPKEIVNVVNKSLMYLNSEYSRTFTFAKNTLNIIYLAHSRRIQTMAIDENMNLYLNAGFVYNVLKMDTELISAVLMHEVFHALFNHIERGSNWLAAKGKSKTPQTQHDNNLAADIEVNQALVRSGIIDENRLINEIHGLYLKNVGGDLGQNTNVVPMEIILNDEKYMAKLRSMCPPPPDPNQAKQDTVKTTDEWNQGYKDAWNKIAGLIKKYGYKKVWEKLMEKGIINGTGEISTEKSIDDIKALEYLTVKDIDEYINEDKSNDEKGKTYEDGFNAAFEKLIGKLEQAMNPDGNKVDDNIEDGENGPAGPQYDSDLKNEDLEEIELPGNNSNGGNNSEGDGLPENIKSTNDSKKSNDKKSNDDKKITEPGSESDNEQGQQGEQNGGQNNKSYGKGGQGKSSDELGSDDINKLSDDISSKGGETSGISDHESVGGTGSFIEKGLSDDELKEAGYSQDDIDAINKVREQNKTNNSREKIQKEIDRMRRILPNSDPVNRYLKAIDIESNKYKNIWNDILEDFMSQKTRRAGKDTPTGYNDWKRKSRIAMGEYGVHHRDESQDPQDVNVYVDVSGSVDEELLEVVCKSLVVFTQEWEYSGMNICPWASTNNGVFKIEDFYEKDEREITEEILSIVSTGISQCGGGTDADAAISAMLDVVEETLADDSKDEKDDIHIVITDGWFDYQNVESRIKSAIMQTVHRADVAEKAPENTIWMIYDAPDDLKEKWKNEIKKGRLVFITSEVVKNNG